MNKENTASTNWQKCSASVFWGEIAPQDHLVQIYEQEEVLLQSLHGFISTGIQDGDSIVIIAARERLNALISRLQLSGLFINELKEKKLLFTLSAESQLEKFMVDGMPDEQKFFELASTIIAGARTNASRKIRAYGEMVAILWEQGNPAAALRLETLWNQFCANEVLTLFCAYPKNIFESDNENECIGLVCAAHNKIISGKIATAEDVFYKRN